MTKYILLDLESQVSDEGIGANAAIVTLSDDYVKVLEERQAKLKELQHYLPDLVELVFRDGAVAFHTLDLEAFLTPEKFEAFEDAHYVEIDGDAVLSAVQAEAGAIAVEKSEVRTDCEELLVTDLGFQWKALEHYSAFNYTTVVVDAGFLAVLLADQPSAGKKDE